MKKFTKALSVMLCAALLLGLLSTLTVAFAAGSPAIDQQEVRGDYRWTLYDDGTLRIEPYGVDTAVIPDFGRSGAPWYNYFLSITHLEVANGITSIGSYAFCGLNALQTVTLGESVTAIGSYAFAECYSLTSATTPLPVSAITIHANGNSALTAALAQSSGGSSSGGSSSGGSSSGGSSSGGSSSGGIISPDGTTLSGSCGEHLTYSLDLTTGTMIISGVGAMDEYPNASIPPWYSKMSSIKTLVVEDGVTSVSDNSFYFCTNLRTARFGNSVVHIGASAFSACTALSEAYIDVAKSAVTIERGNIPLVLVLTYGSNLPVLPDEPDTPPVNPDEPDTPPVNPDDPDTPPVNPDEPDEPDTPPVTPPSTTDGGTIAGTQLSWTLDKTTGALVISGTGALPDFASAAELPWRAYTSTIRSVRVGAGVTAVGKNAFAGHTALTEVTIPATVTAIGENAFLNCSALYSVSLAAGLQSIGPNAFRGCIVLAAITLPDTLRTLENGAFRGCVALESIRLPEGMTAIGDNVFCDCAALATVTLPSTLKTIGAESFFGCKSLQTLIFPAALTSIGSGAFQNCTALRELTILSTATLQVGEDAFYGCSALQRAVYENAEPSIAAGNIPLKNALRAHYGGGVSEEDGIAWHVDRVKGVLTLSGKGAVTDNAAWMDELPYVTTVIFEDGITAIGKSLLRNCSGLELVQLPATLKEIGDYAFAGCASLKLAMLPDSLQTLGEAAFRGCSSLSDITLPILVSAIPDEAFSGCVSLATVTVQGNLVSIGSEAFADCGALRSFTLPATLTTLGTGAFDHCLSLQTLLVAKGGLTTIASNIFDGCAALTTVYFTGNETEWKRMTQNADEEIKNATLAQAYSVTIQYLYPESFRGNYPTSVTLIGAAGQTMAVPSPEIPHYETTSEVVDVTFGVTSVGRTIYVQYVGEIVEVTIIYKNDQGEIWSVKDPYPANYGESYTIYPDTIDGYTPNVPYFEINFIEQDTVVEFVYAPAVYEVTILPVDAKGEPIPGADADGYLLGSFRHGDRVDLSLSLMPALTHYTAAALGDLPAGMDQDGVITADCVIKVVYEKTKYTLNLIPVDRDGQPIEGLSPIPVEITYGETIESYALSELAGGWIPTAESITLTYDAQNTALNVNVEYRLKTFRVTVVYREAGFEDAWAEAFYDVAYNAPFEQEPRAFAGYTPDVAMLKLDAVTEDTTIVVNYFPALCDLIVEMVKPGGESIYTLTISDAFRAGETVDTLLSALLLEDETAAAAVADYVVDGVIVKLTMGTAATTVTLTLQEKPEQTPGTETPGTETPGTETPGTETPGTETPGTVDDPEENSSLKTVLVVVLLVVVLIGAGVAFYVVYLRRRV